MSDVARPSWRASALGVYRLWRNSGYAFGALLGDLLSDGFGIQITVTVIALLTAAAGIVTFMLLPETSAHKAASEAKQRPSNASTTPCANAVPITSVKPCLSARMSSCTRFVFGGSLITTTAVLNASAFSNQSSLNHYHLYDAADIFR